MLKLRIDNYVIEEPIINILNKLQLILNNGKLHDIVEKPTELIVTCPNDEHSSGTEAHPDCHINLQDNDIGFAVFHCFACGAKGSFVHFVALCFGSSDESAKQWLIKNYGKLAYETVVMDEPIMLQQHKKYVHKLDETVLNTYQPWCPYMAKRKLDRDICEKLKIKYDAYNRQIVFPIYDINDNLVMLARRSVDTKFFHMDENVDKPVYCLNIIKKNNVKAAMIVEGLVDCATCWSNGVPAIATLGELSPEQITEINKSGIKFLFVAFDNDAAGRRFNIKLKSRLSPKIITTDVKFPANRKDPNDLTPEEWADLKNNYFSGVKFQ